MKFPITWPIIIFLTLLFAGCGGDDAFNGGGCNPANEPTVISSFLIDGSATVGGTEVINETNDFILSWDLTSSCTYTYQAYLAIDIDLDDSIDIPIASGTCGLGKSCNGNVDITCSFIATTKRISCDGGGPVDVSILLSGVSSAERFFILEATNEMSVSETEASELVRFEY